MTATTLKALKGSIEHWERFATGTALPTETPTSEHCALCKLFFFKDCNGCPIANRTGVGGCADTPYEQAYSAWCHSGVNSDSFKLAASKELAFLKSLLPK